MKISTALLLGLVIAFGVGACGEGEPEKPETPDAPDVPPGIDPEVIADFEAAPVPDPKKFCCSAIREAADKRGLFEDMPEGKAENLAALLQALAPAREKAAGSPGGTEGGPAGPSYLPTDAELVLAELGVRIDDANRASDDATQAAARTASGMSGTIEIPTFRVVTVKVFGTGYVRVLEQTTQTIDLGS
jgi:hypothetical protein